MTDTPPARDGRPPIDLLALTVGCEFELEAAQPVVAIVQVAPRPQPLVRMGRERWDSAGDHYCYIDLYGNRCERSRWRPAWRACPMRPTCC